MQRVPLVWDFRYSHLSTATKSMNSTFDNDKILLLDLPLRMRPTECSNNFKHHLHNKYFFGDFIYFICIVGWERLERPKCLDVYIFDCHFLKAVFNLFSKQYLFTARMNCNPACLVFIQLFLFSKLKVTICGICLLFSSKSFLQKNVLFKSHFTHHHLKSLPLEQTLVVWITTSRKGLEVPDADQIADRHNGRFARWSIGTIKW